MKFSYAAAMVAFCGASIAPAVRADETLFRKLEKTYATAEVPEVISFTQDEAWAGKCVGITSQDSPIPALLHTYVPASDDPVDGGKLYAVLQADPRATLPDTYYLGFDRVAATKAHQSMQSWKAYYTPLTPNLDPVNPELSSEFRSSNGSSTLTLRRAQDRTGHAFYITSSRCPFMQCRINNVVLRRGEVGNFCYYWKEKLGQDTAEPSLPPTPTP